MKSIVMLARRSSLKRGFDRVRLVVEANPLNSPKTKLCRHLDSVRLFVRKQPAVSGRMLTCCASCRGHMRSIAPVLRLRKIEELPNTEHDQSDRSPNQRKSEELCHQNQDRDSNQSKNHQEK